jgi:hypothetical protein
VPAQAVEETVSEVKLAKLLADEILKRLADGDSLASICAEQGMPDERSVRRDTFLALVESDGGDCCPHPSLAIRKSRGFPRSMT